jgi:hypothetical protein
MPVIDSHFRLHPLTIRLVRHEPVLDALLFV